jgi:hypothetical protein
MLELWRPPVAAGDPIGCLASTYTFTPGIFDEQCLARFLEIESEPNREDLAFLLERETRLGGVYAGVLVDHTSAGVDHSFRWDVLPVRIHGGKQHAKVSLLMWSRHIRVIVASANLTDPGYRRNFEVAAGLDFSPEQSDPETLSQSVGFLRSLLAFVPGAADNLPEIRRAAGFLDNVYEHARGWKQRRRSGTVRQRLACTLPGPQGASARSSLDEAIKACWERGNSPHEVWIASPFYDPDPKMNAATASLCKKMARGTHRKLCFAVPSPGSSEICEVLNGPRLAAPRSLITTPLMYAGSSSIHLLPDSEDKNPRPWHAKMLKLVGEGYVGLMAGSSNFTCAGMGIGSNRNAEANVITVVDRVAYGRETPELEAVWPDMERVVNPESAEWLAPSKEPDEDEQSTSPPLPEGFLCASYRAGSDAVIVLRFAPEHLPPEWQMRALESVESEVLSVESWLELGSPKVIERKWLGSAPPMKLIVLWNDCRGFLPINIEDHSKLPAPSHLENMSADDMLGILASSDPSAAFRAWAKRTLHSSDFDDDLDAAVPVELDPLRRYDLQTTFLHRIRHRSRVLAQMRSNIERPVWGRQALEWRLRGLIGVEPLADRFLREFEASSENANESLLTLADFLVVLREVDYKPDDGCLPAMEFNQIFRLFLRDLAERHSQRVSARQSFVSKDAMKFWLRVVARCQE